MRPVDKKWNITNPYGKPGPYIAKVHTGVDFGVPEGTPVRAAWGGRVVTSDYSPADYGNYVVVETFWRRKRLLYAHLSHRSVSVGQRARRGSIIGLSGNTGHSTGPHVHVEQRHSPFGYWNFEKPTFL